jgi:hypothetical protein
MKIKNCRLCRGTQFHQIINLGTMSYTGIFPKKDDHSTPIGELNLILCEKCGLVQLEESFPPSLLFGENYGYRSGLNNSMVSHLQSIASKLEQQTNLKGGQVVLDIASNDGTLLKGYKTPGLTKVGIDPTINKFKDHYETNAIRICDFFSSEVYFKSHPIKPMIITSIAMLYDLEDPNDFFQNVFDALDDNGVWYFEQSYAPWMAETGSFDTICHEHLEYYSLTVINKLLELNNFKLVDAFTNDSNGGSISVVAAKSTNKSLSISPNAEWLLEVEKIKGVSNPLYWDNFATLATRNRDVLVDLVERLVNKNMKILGLGASTKGNVLLQFCNFDSKVIQAIGEVNEYKFGKMTPGSTIPIIPENEIYEMCPDYLLVLPWHFKSTFLKKSEKFLHTGGKLLFPLPQPEIVSTI